MELLLLCGRRFWGGVGRRGKGREVGHVCTYRVGPYIFYFFTFKEGGRNEMNTKGGLLGRP